MAKIAFSTNCAGTYMKKSERYSIPHITHINSFEADHRPSMKIKTIKFLEGLWSEEKFLREYIESINHKMIHQSLLK